MPTPREIRIAAIDAASRLPTVETSQDVITEAQRFEAWIAEASDEWDPRPSSPETVSR